MRILRPGALIAVLLMLAAGLAVPLGCGDGEETDSAGKLGVVVSIAPQAEFVEKVGGENVDVTVMVPSGASPHAYEVTPGQMKALAEAEMYAKVGSGVDFEVVWMDRLEAANDDMLVVDCSEGVQLIPMAGEDEPEEADHQGAMDPHIWLSPPNAKSMVENIYAGLLQVDPENKAYYESNRDAYLRELTELDQDIKDGLAGVTNRRFMVYHPAFGYFAEEYDLTMLPIEEEGKEPTAAGIAHLIDEAKEHNIKVIFVSPQFNPQSAKVIAGEIGGSVVSIDPLARDYVENLRIVLGELVQAME
ncbi:MAG: hypothetical protein AMJ77_03845 [Dehalococcoidia bacterium SM23_28_2]|nr:MAG: hypothetical protein AMJ77_03845 [Dehalococcoidia bacterium SM23_28_2]